MNSTVIHTKRAVSVGALAFTNGTTDVQFTTDRVIGGEQHTYILADVGPEFLQMLLQAYLNAQDDAKPDNGTMGVFNKVLG